MPSDNEAQKKRLLDLISQTAEGAARVQKPLQDIQDDVHFFAEIAPAAQDYFQDVSPEAQTSEEWARQVSSWQSANLVVGRIEASIVLSSEASSASYTTAAVTNTATWFASTSGIPPTPRMRAAEDRIKVIQRRRPLLEDARASMRRLALDKPSGGQRAALEILDEASAALAKGIPSALVTLRDGIWAAVSQLNQRKPAQETASGLDMVTSIGRQTKWTYLDDNYFERLVVDGEPLIGRLSGAKNKAMSGQQVSDVFDEGLVFLNAVLTGIDNARLRQRKA